MAITFDDLLINPVFKPTDELSKLIDKNSQIDFWKELILYVVPDASIQSYHITPLSSIVLRHHSFGENQFEIFRNGDFRGAANIIRIYAFFKAANVPFLSTY